METRRRGDTGFYSPSPLFSVSPCQAVHYNSTIYRSHSTCFIPLFFC
jgi:hypothetical protein